ncbi:MAG: PAS domain S-box protein [Cyclobacteriaceae bacterium]|nr:PAS domain S-box protein [Cyclobacteriaceae bacterium]
MKSKSTDLALFTLGVLLTATIFLSEIISVVSFLGAATYILVIIFILWLPGKSSYATALGIITTVAIIAGYLITIEWLNITWDGVDHRIFTIVILWLAIYFTMRYKNFTEHERLQKEKLNADLEIRVQKRTYELEEALIGLEQANQNLQQEISEKQRAEEKLRSSQQLHRAMAHNFPNGIIGVLNDALNYVFVDGKELELIGLSTTKLIGKKIFNDVYPTLNKHAEPFLGKAFSGETASFEVSLADREYNVKAVPLPDTNGQIHEILIVINNITPLKKMQTDLLQALEKEHELGELKSRFVTMASHEFRTPLSTILSSIFLLENYTGEDFEREKMTHINRIKRSVNNLTEILNDFLSLGKLEEGKVKVSYADLHIEDFMEMLIKEIEVVKNPEQSITYTHSGNQIVSTDKHLLKNIMLNLISNAFKYSPKSGCVLVTSKVTADLLTLKVTDTGIGIPEDDQRHIFKRFFRAQNAMNLQGTGLGLNIVKKYTTLLSGKVGFKSALGKGTTFAVTLPTHQRLQHEESNKHKNSKLLNQQV